MESLMHSKLPAIALATLSTLAANAAGGGSEAGSNTWFGYFSANALTTGSENVLYGAFAGQRVTTGSNNIAVGGAAGSGISTASGNVALGTSTGYNNGGSYNVFLG